MTSLWRSHSVVTARLLTRNYVQSPWVVIEIAILLGLVYVSPSGSSMPGDPTLCQGSS